VVARRDQHVQGVGGPDDGLEGGEVAARHRRLEEGRTVGRSDQAPRLVLGPLRRQLAEEARPVAGARRNVGPPGTVQGHGGELDEEGVPGMTLVRAQRRELGHSVFGQERKDLRQRAPHPLAGRGADPDQRLGQQVQHHSISLIAASPNRP
jgi:hypothetical protein